MRKLKLLFAVAALAMGGVCTVNAQTDGEYYLYDSTAKVFLTRGASYGTEGSADKYGIPVIWNSTDGTIRFKDWSDTGLFKTETAAIFTDGTAGKWAFEAVTGGYLLKYVEDGDYGVYYWGAVSCNGGCLSLASVRLSRDEGIDMSLNEFLDDVSCITISE